jgi:hypothetical protein
MVPVASDKSINKKGFVKKFLPDPPKRPLTIYFDQCKVVLLILFRCYIKRQASDLAGPQLSHFA